MEGDNAAPGGTATNGNGTSNVGATSGHQPQITVNDNGVRDMRDAETRRISNIRAWGRDHAIDADKVSAWIANGTSDDQVSREINGILQERIAKPIQTVTGPVLTEHDQRRFSFARALILNTELYAECRAQSGGSKIDFGLEREIIQEVMRTTPMQRGGNVVMPLTMLARAGVDTSNTTGGPFKFTQPGEFIPILRNRTSVMRAGATVLTGLTGPLTFPRQTGSASTSYSAENPGSDITVTNLTTGSVTLSFKSLGAATAYSRQLLFSAASGNYQADMMIQDDLNRVVGLAIDLGALNGSGATNNPRGVLKNTSIGSVLAGNGTNGGSATWNTFVDLEGKIGDANADAARMAYITNTKQRSAAKKIAPLGSTNSGIPVWTGPYPITPGAAQAAGMDNAMDGMVNGYRAIASNQVPSNITVGADTACSAIVFGAWEHQLIGMFGTGFETIIDPFSKKFQGMVEVAAWVFFDANQRYDGAFAACQDAK